MEESDKEKQAIETNELIKRAIAYDKKGDYVRAVADCTEAIRLNPNDADPETGLINESLTPNEDFIITGHRIKITKGEPGCGLFLVGPLTGGAGPETEIPKFTENTASKVIARAPASLTPGKYKIVIKTKYSGGGNLLKDVRTIETPFTLTVS